jgi:CrcB protein
VTAKHLRFSPMYVVALAVAGAAGVLARAALGRALEPWSASFPWATFVVNALGCFGFGLLWALAAGRWSPTVTAAVFVGFFGGFTTFSSFAFDTVRLLEQQHYAAAVANVLGQNVLGLALLASGLALGRTSAA